MINYLQLFSIKLLSCKINIEFFFILTYRFANIIILYFFLVKIIYYILQISFNIYYKKHFFIIYY